MSCLTTYTLNCLDDRTGKVGCFVFDREYYMQTGRFRTTEQCPIIHDSLAELFRWDRMQYPKVFCFGAYTNGPSDSKGEAA